MSYEKSKSRIYPIKLVDNTTVYLTFSDLKLSVEFLNEKITISNDRENYTEINLVNQQTASKASIIGSYAPSEKTFGKSDYKEYFFVEWSSETVDPELHCYKTPDRISREYIKGQKIELGIEPVKCYHVHYEDGVKADFRNTGSESYDFEFSTGFSGSIKRDEDGYHYIKFKGIRWDADKDDYDSESKFLITRSKYSDNLILVLQDNASVLLEH